MTAAPYATMSRPKEASFAAPDICSKCYASGQCERSVTARVGLPETQMSFQQNLDNFQYCTELLTLFTHALVSSTLWLLTISSYCCSVPHFLFVVLPT